ncbi:MAG: hypothetical protein ACRDBG_12305 [Waterburya sp.]
MTDQRFSFYSQEQSAVLIARLRQQQEQNFDYLEIEREQDLEAWIAKIEQESCFIALDTETKGLTPAPGRVRTVQIAYSQDVPVLIVKLSKIKNRSCLQRLLANPKLLKIGHHLKFDILMLAAEGIKVKPPVMCTLLGFEVLKAGATKQASLQFVAQELLNIKLDKAQQHSDWAGKLTPTQLQYAANDAGILVKLLPELQSRLELANLSQIAILEYYCLLPLAQMQSRGINLDFQRWQKVRQDYELKRENLAEEIYQELGQRFNIASPKQLL